MKVFKKNCCDGIYNSFDVHFTSACDNKCSHCVDACYEGSGILIPDSGEVKINDMVPWKEREKYVSNIGVVFGQRSQLWWDIPAEDTFDLLRDIYSLDEDEYLKTKKELVKLLIKNV